MAKHAKAPARSAKTLGAVGMGSFFVAAAFSGLGAGTASAVGVSVIHSLMGNHRYRDTTLESKTKLFNHVWGMCRLIFS